MFVGMTFGLVLHAIVVYFRLPFPGYPEHDKPQQLLNGKNNAVEEGLVSSNIAMSNYGSVKQPEEKDPLLVNGADTEIPARQEIPIWMCTSI